MSARSVFADLLAEYRNQAGWTQAEAARRFSMSKSLYQKIESCDRKPQRDMADLSDELFGTRKVFARIYKDILTEPYPVWFGPSVEYEDRATVITDWEQRGIPGMLQTEEYARAVFRACHPYMSPEALERSVQARLDRQDIFARDSPPKFWAILAEGVLRQLVGGREVMAKQLDHLVTMSESSRAVIQVFPFTATDVPGMDGPITMFEFEDRPPVVYLESWITGQIIEDPQDVANIATTLNMIRGCALSPADSRQLITDIRG